MTCLYMRTHAHVSEKRAESILYERNWENLATYGDKINIAMTIQIWNITFSWQLLEKTIQYQFSNTTRYFPMCKNSNTLFISDAILMWIRFLFNTDLCPTAQDSMHDLKINSLAIFFCRRVRSYSEISIREWKGRWIQYYSHICFLCFRIRQCLILKLRWRY